MTDEKKFRETIKSYRKEAPENPFFTKKVMNRLPEKKWNKEDSFMLAIYSVCIIITFASWFIFAVKSGIFEGNLNLAGSDILFFVSFMAILAAEIWQAARLVVKE